jgi:transaldolase/glucose-6-phosphate isomerase
MSNAIKQTTALGQSLWYDNVQRRLLENGEFEAMIRRGEFRGMTSNPSIFQNAIAKSTDYDSALVPLAWSGWGAEQIFWRLAVEDIKSAADLFLPLYHESNGGDGYVSLEVSPNLAEDAVNTLSEAKRLWAEVDRPNLMIKIPATRACLPAIRQAIAAGINVNVTLIFSNERYVEVMDAYLAGLEDRAKAGGAIDRIASVASFFISRLDGKVDPRLPEGSPLRGKAAIANARLAYQIFRRTFAGPRWEALAARGARLQRPLWASTSTKNPAYPDTLYVDELIGPDTVNTVPPATLTAFADHGKAALTIENDLYAANRLTADLAALGIDLMQVTAELEAEGVKAFVDAFASLLETMETRRKSAVAQLGSLAAPVKTRVAKLQTDSVPARLHAIDPSLWTADPAGQAEIKIRLGWLGLPHTSRAVAAEAAAFAAEIHKDTAIKGVLLLGMGGSSLAPEVMSLVAGETKLKFAIVDSTDADQVAQAAKNFPPASSLYIVASKSGGTAEVNAFFHYFWGLSLGDGSRFIAITDPNTSLEKLAKERGFRKTFLADPNVGGRYSVLTAFGLVPAALMGIDPQKFLARAAWMAAQSVADVPAARNPGLVLGAVLAEAAFAGRDKVTVIADKPFTSVGSWLEQLVAESSGKFGKGTLPIDLEPLAEPSAYGADRLFVYLRVTGESDAKLSALQQAGFPVLVFPMADVYDLAAEFYRWEITTAAVCHIFGVNAFDQPNVQDSKNRTVAKIKAFNENGALDEGTPFWQAGGFKATAPAPLPGADLKSILAAFLGQGEKNAFVAINAYLPRNAAVEADLTALRVAIRAKTKFATAVGFGPRFQHSTGQYHKGGPNQGLFLQLIADPAADMEIPEEGLNFSTLERAQALGDYEALVASGRKVLRIHLPNAAAVRELTQAL